MKTDARAGDHPADARLSFDGGAECLQDVLARRLAGRSSPACPKGRIRRHVEEMLELVGEDDYGDPGGLGNLFGQGRRGHEDLVPVGTSGPVQAKGPRDRRCQSGVDYSRLGGKFVGRGGRSDLGTPRPTGVGSDHGPDHLDQVGLECGGSAVHGEPGHGDRRTRHRRPRQEVIEDPALADPPRPDEGEMALDTTTTHVAAEGVETRSLHVAVDERHGDHPLTTL